MYKFLNILMLGAALSAPVAVHAQERNAQERHAQERQYEDKVHHDSHTWNSDEDERYRNYLREHHKKYRDFNRMNRRDQDNYWNWRHSH
jgi:Ni/Co efflux regulator RcnB